MHSGSQPRYRCRGSAAVWRVALPSWVRAALSDIPVSIPPVDPVVPTVRTVAAAPAKPARAQSAPRAALGALREALANDGIRRLGISWTLGIAADTALVVVILVTVFNRGGVVAAGLV